MKIVQTLLDRQGAKHYLTEDDMRQAALDLAEPLYRIQEVVSFYPHFKTAPPPELQVAVCRDMSCRLRDAEGVCEALRQRFGDDPSFELHEVSCLGRCDRAPAALINETDLSAGRCASELVELVESYQSGQPAAPDTDSACTTGNLQDWQIDPYSSQQDRYQGVRNYLQSPDPAAVIQALETAGLLGMGGAGGRAYKKWDDVLRASGEKKYVICNADESEPGTFKDRELLLRAPHVLVEGMILGGLVTGATEGYVYIRHEYPEVLKSVQAEIDRAVAVKACGSDVFGSGKAFHLDVFVSPGGYICGEQTALIEAMEGKRAQPRNRPPQLQTNGLFDKPTLLNNVETFAWVPNIVLKNRGQWFAEQGWSSQFKGRRLFSISGDVQRPGAYEVPNGITIGQLLDEYAGGIQGGNQLKAIALSGPSGGFTPARLPVEFISRRFLEAIDHSGETFDIRDLPMDIGISRQTGIMLGAGIVVYDHTRDMIDQAWACARFFHDESCGKCVPCRLGSHKVVEMVDDVRRRTTERVDDLLPVVESLSNTMEMTSICGLGMVASNPLKTLLRYFKSDVLEHLGQP